MLVPICFLLLLNNVYPYISHGLGIHSALELPELVASVEAPAEVVIQRRRIDRTPGATDASGRYAWATEGEAYLYWDHVGAFLIEKGRTITIDPLPGVEKDLLRLPLLGPVMALLLHQRGFLVLHASAVAIGGQVVAFIGRKGWGKSTTAAALHARGHPLVTDDTLAVDLREDEITGEVRVAPGFPQLKLWPEAAEASLGDDPDMLPVLHRRVRKKARSVRAGFSPSALPLRRIYVLGKGPSLSVEPVAPQQAFLELTRHSFNQGLVKSNKFAPAHFRKRTELARRVPLRRLKRTVSLDALGEIARLVEDDVLRNAESAAALDV